MQPLARRCRRACNATALPVRPYPNPFSSPPVAQGLAYLHGLGKVHRDIKCGNILLAESGQARLGGGWRQDVAGKGPGAPLGSVQRVLARPPLPTDQPTNPTGTPPAHLRR